MWYTAPLNEGNVNNNGMLLPNLQVLPEVEQIPEQQLANNEEPLTSCSRYSKLQ